MKTLLVTLVLLGGLISCRSEEAAPQAKEAHRPPAMQVGRGEAQDIFELKQTIKLDLHIGALEMSSDSKSAVIVTSAEIRPLGKTPARITLLENSTGREEWTVNSSKGGESDAAAFTPDGKNLIVFGLYHTILMDRSSGKIARELDDVKYVKHAQYLAGGPVCLLEDTLGEPLFLVDIDKQREVQIQTRLQPLLSHSSELDLPLRYFASMVPGTQLLATGSIDNAVILWEIDPWIGGAATWPQAGMELGDIPGHDLGAPLVTLHEVERLKEERAKNVLMTVCSPDGQLLFSYAANFAEPPKPHLWPVNPNRDPDGRPTIADLHNAREGSKLGKETGFGRLWDLPTHKARVDLTVNGEPPCVEGAAFTADGLHLVALVRQIAKGKPAGSILVVWATSDGSVVQVLPAHAREEKGISTNAIRLARKSAPRRTL